MGHLWCPTKTCRRDGKPRCDVCELVDAFANGLAEQVRTDTREQCALIAEVCTDADGDCAKNIAKAIRGGVVDEAFKKDIKNATDRERKRIAERAEAQPWQGALGWAEAIRHDKWDV